MKRFGKSANGSHWVFAKRALGLLVILLTAAILAVGCGSSSSSSSSTDEGGSTPDTGGDGTGGDAAGFTIGSLSGNTAEDGTTGTFTVKLNAQPDGDVAINVASSNTGEGTVDVSSLTFDATNWNVDQTVTVTGVDDSVVDGDQAYTVELTVNTAGTTDTTGYAALDPADMSVVNADNDVPDNTAPVLPTVSINNADASTDSPEVTLSLSASDDIGIVAYYAAETDSTPDATAVGWTDVTAVTGFSGDVAFVFGNNIGLRSVYVWFKDAAGNISDLSTASINVMRPVLPDTGQTTSYTNTFGEDADYTINPPSYTFNFDSQTTTDNNTLLTWENSGHGGNNWEGAISRCEILNTGGFTDWRLPTIKEYLTIIDYTKTAPTIDTSIFTNIQTDPWYNWSAYWSSTDFADSDGRAWGMDFNNGLIENNDKSQNGYTKCVRGGDETTVWPSDFTDTGNGFITHGFTGLKWQKEDDDTTRTWEEALAYCEGLDLGGFGNWRLPSVRELETIIDFGNYDPAIDPVYFPDAYDTSIDGAVNSFWSSTTVKNTSSNGTTAWQVSFKKGSVGGGLKDSKYYVRCVQGGLLPSQTATSVNFTDSDDDADELTGDVTIVKASDEGSLSDYVLYWSAAATKQDETLIATIAKTGSDLTYTFSADSPVPKDANYLLVFTLNEEGEMETGLSVALDDVDRVQRLLPDTGFTEDVNDTTGDDSDYPANPLSFTDNGDNTVTDNNTQLMWQKEGDGTNNASYGYIGWTEAVAYCNGLNLADYNDWRLPSITEIVSKLNYGHIADGEAKISTEFFPADVGDFWSSTYQSNPNPNHEVWTASYGTGRTDRRRIDSTLKSYVQCVRGGSAADVWKFDLSHNGVYLHSATIIAHGSTNLMWQRNTNVGLPDWEDRKANWSDAISYCESIVIDGYTDWRLPNIKELQSIVDYSKQVPSLHSDFELPWTWPDPTDRIYWSSTPFVNTYYQGQPYQKIYAASFKFGELMLNDLSEELLVRCVHTGKLD
ncbi:MAG: DUF1566 domain-containing protein [Proteobacteria bacterium]|nr:DUF1566 domain-containing protein [Pseudomonadota bacterium]